jgi:hypothetical protein
MKLTQYQVKDFVCKDYDRTEFNQVDEIEGDDRRWYRRVTLIFKKIETGKFYSICYDKGLTENQENDYWDQDAIEVIKVEKEVTAIVVTWEEANPKVEEAPIKPVSPVI